MSEEQNIRDLFDKMARRPPTAAEIARFTNTSNYAVESYIMTLPEFTNSNQYQERGSRIKEMHLQIFGYDVDPAYVDQWVRAGVTDSQLLYEWRKTPNYRQMFQGKPEWMTESEYRTIYYQKADNEQAVRDDFRAFSGKELTADEVNKIFYGGVGSEGIRKEYARVKGLRASHEAQRNKAAATTVQTTPMGPVQPMMRGISSTGAGEPYRPSEQQSPPGPRPGPRWLSYADYQQGRENPAWKPSEGEMSLP